MAYLFKTLAATATPVRITGADIAVRKATFFAYSGFAAGVPRPNSGTLYLGPESGRLPIVINPSGGYTFEVPYAHADIRDTLKNFWVQGTVGDGVYVWYY